MNQEIRNCNSNRRAKKIINGLCVFSMIITSGGGYLNSIFFLLGSAFLCLLFYRKISKKAVIISVFLLLFGVFNSIVINNRYLDLHQFIIFSIRIISLMIIVDKLSIFEFKKDLVSIMTILAVFSLFWYSILLVFPNYILPFEVASHDPYFGSFYHIIGFTRSDHIRNAGIFWEPGVYQIYLNLAIAILFNEGQKYKKYKIKLVILLITLITTFSTGGFIILIITILFAITDNKSNYRNKIRAFTVPLILCLTFIEIQTNTLSNKIINHSGSYASRHDDTLIGLGLFLKNPIIGIGLASNSKSALSTVEVANLLYSNRDDLASSNGLVNLLFRVGILFSLLFIWFIYRGYLRWFNEKKRTAIQFLIITLLAFFNEPLALTPFWLGFFYKMKRGYKNEVMENKISSF